MKIIELVLNEEEELNGIEAISVVENPAIEENWVALKKHEIQLKTVDEEKRLLMGMALIPKKQIFRRNEKTGEEFYIYFSKKTIRKASELFFKKSNQNNTTLEHETKLKGLTVVESWIVEDTIKDKSNLYGFNAVEGTWMISMKVDNDEVWKEVKNGSIKGFSIEGYFAERLEASKQLFKSEVIDNDIAIIDDRNAYSTKEKALEVAKDVGCNGYHEHEFEGKTWYMPCEKHTKNNDEETLSKLKNLINKYEENLKKKRKKKKKKKY